MARKSRGVYCLPMYKSFSAKPPTTGGGLWAYHEGRFYARPHDPANPHLDHVTWFQSLNLPDFGPAFDRILRGRMTWDRHFDHFVLTYYGARFLPNQVYELVTRFFNPKGERVVESPASRHWV